MLSFKKVKQIMLSNEDVQRQLRDLGYVRINDDLYIPDLSPLRETEELRELRYLIGAPTPDSTKQVFDDLIRQARRALHTPQ